MVGFFDWFVWNLSCFYSKWLNRLSCPILSWPCSSKLSLVWVGAATAEWFCDYLCFYISPVMWGGKTWKKKGFIKIKPCNSTFSIFIEGENLRSNWPFFVSSKNGKSAFLLASLNGVHISQFHFMFSGLWKSQDSCLYYLYRCKFSMWHTPLTCWYIESHVICFSTCL